MRENAGERVAQTPLCEPARVRHGVLRMPRWSVLRPAVVDERQIDELATVLIDCVEGGATVGFMMPLSRGRAPSF